MAYFHGETWENFSELRLREHGSPVEQERSAQPSRPGLGRSRRVRLEVGQHAQHREERAEQIRLGRGPGHHLGPHRVDREEGDRERRHQQEPQIVGLLQVGPASPDQGEGQWEEHDRIQRVHQGAGEVVAVGVDAGEEVLDLQRHPGDGLVDADEHRGPGPADIRPADPTKAGVVDEIGVIVEGDEAVAQGRAEREEHQ